ncbi:helix-turn-helix transcriptional regulator [Ruminococcaceae bacterium OttesenSCG-928-A16]|nr:helix-turn-helix transcriptional regulator [Ruminococcaceae bacterium OttesenSCG-928-A16]
MMANMYETIERLCQQAGTNVTAMCRELGLSRSALSELKQGRTKSLSYQYIAAIAGYFNVSPAVIAGEETDETKKPPALQDEELLGYLEELRTRPEMRMYFSLAKGASKEDVETAVRIVEAYLKGNKEEDGLE